MARPLKYGARFWLRLDPELLAKLDQWRAKAGVTRSQAVRVAIERLVRSKPKLD